jgi:hypothetical protein
MHPLAKKHQPHKKMSDTNQHRNTPESGLHGATCSAGAVTAEMIREMLGHVPFDVSDMPDQWEWMANYLNETLRDPGVICPCCNITRDGQLMDHLPPPPPNAAKHS